MTEPTNKPTGEQPQHPGLTRENVGGAEIVRDRKYCDAWADQLHTEFLLGDSLALFRCVDMWQEEKQPSSSLPIWVIDKLAQICGTYYRERVEWIENEAREWVEKETAARAGKEPLDSRLKKPRSFETIAGISRGQGKPDAWKFGKDDAMRAYSDAIVQKAKSDPGLNKDSPLNARLIPGRFLRLRTLSAGGVVGAVRILNDRGQPREDFEHAIMELFGVGSSKGNKARTARRRLGSMADK